MEVSNRLAVAEIENMERWLTEDKVDTLSRGKCLMILQQLLAAERDRDEMEKVAKSVFDNHYAKAYSFFLTGCGCDYCNALRPLLSGLHPATTPEEAPE